MFFFWAVNIVSSFYSSFDKTKEFLKGQKMTNDGFEISSSRDF